MEAKRGLQHFLRNPRAFFLASSKKHFFFKVREQRTFFHKVFHSPRDVVEKWSSLPSTATTNQPFYQKIDHERKSRRPLCGKVAVWGKDTGYKKGAPTFLASHCHKTSENQYVRKLTPPDSRHAKLVTFLT